MTARRPVSALANEAFEALADANRRQILTLLADRELAVRDIAAALPISRPAVSRHLRVLKQAGLVSERPDGARRLYRLEDEGIEAVQAYLQQVWGEAAARFRLMAENTTPVPP
jgi:DNA-binding transcriptional ArsR family regulator